MSRHLQPRPFLAGVGRDTSHSLALGGSLSVFVGLTHAKPKKYLRTIVPANPSNYTQMLNDNLPMESFEAAAVLIRCHIASRQGHDWQSDVGDWSSLLSVLGNALSEPLP